MFCKRRRTNGMQDSFLYQTRSRSKTMLIPSLPDDLINYILSRVPAEFWEKHIKSVCKAWASIPNDLHFIKMHLSHAKPCLYIQDNKGFGLQFIAINGFKSNVVHKFPPLPGRMCDSNEGLLLIRVKDPPGIFFIANPINKQVMKLSFEPEPNNRMHYAFGLAKIVRTENGQVKIMLFGREERSDGRVLLHWYVLTVGVDESWRKISCAGVLKFGFYPSVNIAVGGVTYWNNRFDIRYTLAVDLNDETCHLLLPPEGVKKINKTYDRWHFVKIQNRLGVASWTRHDNVIKLWVLKDLRKNIWEKVICMDIVRARILQIGFTSLVTFLDDQQVLVFQVHCRGKTRLIAIDVKTKKVKTMRKFLIYSRDIGLHINSIVAI